MHEKQVPQMKSVLTKALEEAKQKMVCEQQHETENSR
jgi:hypothetical protein